MHVLLYWYVGSVRRWERSHLGDLRASGDDPSRKVWLTREGQVRPGSRNPPKHLRELRVGPTPSRRHSPQGSTVNTQSTGVDHHRRVRTLVAVQYHCLRVWRPPRPAYPDPITIAARVDSSGRSTQRVARTAPALTGGGSTARACRPASRTETWSASAPDTITSPRPPAFHPTCPHRLAHPRAVKTARHRPVVASACSPLPRRLP